LRAIRPSPERSIQLIGTCYLKELIGDEESGMGLMF
jgi:hypothetical protein